MDPNSATPNTPPRPRYADWPVAINSSPKRSPKPTKSYINWCTGSPPALLALPGVGPEVAGQVLISAGDNLDRIKSEAAFAHLCGAAPIPASSGRIHRHRLNRGGHRGANNALYVVVLGRLRYDPRTRAYAERRTDEGVSKPEIIRCLKRYVTREIFNALPIWSLTTILRTYLPDHRSIDRLRGIAG